MCDNKLRITIDYDLVQQEQTQHINIDWKFIEDNIESEGIYTHYGKSSEERVNIFAKGT